MIKFSHLSSLYRKLFGVLLPVLLTTAAALMAVNYYNLLQKQKHLSQKETWQDNALLLSAIAHQNHDFSSQVSHQANLLSRKINALEPSERKNVFQTQAFEELFSKQFQGRLLAKDTWAFKKSGNRYERITGSPFSNTRFAIMRNALSNLSMIATSTDEREIHSLSRSVSNLFGSRSNPESIARYREGRLTPVMFGGTRSYLFWRRFMSDEDIYGGIIMIYSSEEVEDFHKNLKSVADKIFNQTNQSVAAAFVPVKYFDKEPVILPSAFEKNTRIKKDTLELLMSANKQIKTNSSVFEYDNHFFSRHVISTDLIYELMVFSPKPYCYESAQVSTETVIFIFTIIWLITFVLNRLINAQTGLPLHISFRLLFIFSGMLPVLVILQQGTNIIFLERQANIQKAQESAFRSLREVNESSNRVANYFTHKLKQLTNQPKYTSKLSSEDIEKRQLGIEMTKKYLNNHGLDLSAIMIGKPGKAIITQATDISHHISAKNIDRFVGASLYYANKSFRQANPLSFELDSSQRTWAPLLESFDKPYVTRFFIQSLERQNQFRIADGDRLILYSAILSENDLPTAYFTFVLEPSEIYRQLIAHELSKANVGSNASFFAVKKLHNTDIDLFPIRDLTILKSDIGIAAGNFMDFLAGTSEEAKVLYRQNLIVYEPLNLIPDYYAGAIVCLSAINRDYEHGILFLHALTVLICCLLIILASYSTAYVIEPLGKLKHLLEMINSGSLEVTMSSERNDDIGKLFNTLALMLKGFKNRLKLGKFVSSTFEKNLDKFDFDEKNRAKNLTGTVLFSDIRNFTTISEEFSPESVAEMLNRHLEKISKVISSNHGEIEQYIGDAVVAFFPDNKEQLGAENALKAAKAMNIAHRDTVNQRLSIGETGYSIGIGLASGEITLGTIMTDQRSEVFLIGQARREAEFNEAFSKQGNHSKIIVSKAIFELFKDKIKFVTLENSDLYEIFE